MSKMPWSKFRQLIFCLIFLGVSAFAEEIWITNKPFSGQVVKDGGQTWVELAPFAKALKVGSAVEAGQATIDGKPVPSQLRGEAVMVPLKEAATAAGAILRDNKSMGIVDVFKGVEEQDPSTLAAASAQDNAATGGDGKVLKMAAYILTLPPDMQVSRDAQKLQAFGLGAMKSGAALGEKYGVKATPQIICDAMLFNKGDTEFKRGFGVLAYTPLPSFPPGTPMPTEDQVGGIQVQALQIAAQELGLTPSAPLSQTQLGGKSFGMLEGSLPAKGLNMKLLLRVDMKTRRQYLVMAAWPMANPESAAAFERAIAGIQTK